MTFGAHHSRYDPGEQRLDIDTADRMMRDTLSQSARPSFRILSRLQKRIHTALTLWTGRLLKYGTHIPNCQEVRTNGQLNCTCGFEQAEIEARKHG